MSLLLECPNCRRHVRESACPFCGARVERRAILPMVGYRISRLALATGMLACTAQPHPASRNVTEAMEPETLPLGVSAEEIDPTLITALEDPGGSDERIKPRPRPPQRRIVYQRYRLVQPYGTPPPNEELV